MDSFPPFVCAETARSAKLLGLVLMRSESESRFFSAGGFGDAWDDGVGTFFLRGKAVVTDVSITRLVNGLLLADTPRMVLAGEFAGGAGAPCLRIDACDDG